MLHTLRHGGTIVEIIEVHSHKIFPGCGNGTIHQNFCCRWVCTLGGGESIKIEDTPYHSYSYMVPFFFLWLDFVHNPSIGWLFVFWYTILVDEENRVIDCWHSGNDSLSYPSQVI